MGQEGNSAFSAFVSYSHADKAAAQKLHRKLEGYRLPKHVAAQLAGRDQGNGEAAEGKADGRLGQIFRDREDLPAAQDLSQSVKEALTGSGALVVLCSPAAKASPWVSREIELFRELHPKRPVLAALIEGEPADAFPEPLLQGGEPLAADLRKEGDGPRLGFLKVVAGIAGVPLDALVQRDAQRRLRRVTMITGGAVLAMLAMAIMTFIAIQSSFEAQRQRAEAEDLVEYMLTDLRRELKGVGRLDVMTGVNERAMDYYERQGDLSDLPAESLERRARILHAMGEDDEKRGDLDKALKKFKEAHRVTKTLLARDSNNPDRIFGHAQSEYWVGRVHQLSRQANKAIFRFNRYRALAEKLVAIERTAFRSAMERAYSENNLGIAKLRLLNRPIESKLHFENAIKWFYLARQRTETEDEVNLEIANANAWLSDSFFFTKNFKEALEIRRNEAVILQALLRRDNSNRDIIYRSLVNRNAQIEIQFQIYGQASKASRDDTLLSDVEELIRSDRRNVKWQNLRRNIVENIQIGE